MESLRIIVVGFAGASLARWLRQEGLILGSWTSEAMEPRNTIGRAGGSGWEDR